MQFRKKPVVIEAVRWTGDNYEEVKAFLGRDFECQHTCHQSISVRTLEGSLHGNLGDWFIRGVKGEHYPCKPDIFAATYEPVEDQLWRTSHEPA